MSAPAPQPSATAGDSPRPIPGAGEPPRALHATWRIRVALVCMACHRPITRSAMGYAVVNRRAAGLVARDGGRVPWLLVHTGCHRVQKPHEFRLRDNELSTLHRLVRASGRVMRQPWAAGTDWAGLVDYLLKHTSRAAAAEDAEARLAAHRHAEAAKRADPAKHAAQQLISGE